MYVPLYLLRNKPICHFNYAFHLYRMTTCTQIITVQIRLPIPLWLWNPEQTSAEAQNRGICVPKNGHIRPKTLKKTDPLTTTSLIDWVVEHWIDKPDCWINSHWRQPFAAKLVYLSLKVFDANVPMLPTLCCWWKNRFFLQGDAPSGQTSRRRQTPRVGRPL